MALIDKLSAIGDAIREKNGTTDLIPLGDMPAAIQAIQTGGDIPEEAFVFTGNLNHAFSYNKWKWFLTQYGNQITTNDITTATDMFNYCYYDIPESLPFDFNFKQGTTASTQYMFSNANGLKHIGNIVNLWFGSSAEGMFNKCYNLRSLPNFINADFSKLHTATYSCSVSNMFIQCCSLRSIPEDFVKELYNKGSYYTQFTYSGFSQCYVLDEIRGLMLSGDVAFTSNCFNHEQCCRLKNYIFATQEDGTPYVRSLKNQTINLSNYIGYSFSDASKLTTAYNSGITTDKEVYDDATYQALKNDADWFSRKPEYSRYNHDSAVATINSLPDTSAYLATAGGTNTIKFKGVSGSATDGGAINTLTEEEIAVATAKGWTVTLS